MLCMEDDNLFTNAHHLLYSVCSLSAVFLSFSRSAREISFVLGLDKCIKVRFSA